MFKKKIGIYALTLAMAAMGMTGCASSEAASPAEEKQGSVTKKSDNKTDDNNTDDETFSVVCTIFPEYDWVKEILGDHADNAELTYLLDNGVDLHSYQPTADDIMKISTCDLFVYVGGESDEWVEEALADVQNKDMKVINLMDVLGDSAKVEELKEGMQAGEHEHDHEHAEIEEADIKDRELSDFAGSWQSLYPFLESGDLDEYVKSHAEEHGEPEEEVREELAEKWNCDLTAADIDGDKISFTYKDGTKKSGEYKYAGYSPILADDGDIKAVMYQFEAVSGDGPKYVMFNDHGYEPATAEHFHIYYGDDADFAATKENFKYNPFFLPADLDGEGALEMLEGHGKGKSDHDHDHEHEEGEEEYDEHVWLSLKNAKVLCAEIEQNLEAVDPDNAADYKANLDSYAAKLDALDNDFQALVDASSAKTLVFGDRFPFRYFVDDYGLDYYAAFIGCSAETEASFETIAFLSDKIKELDCKAIFTLENSDKGIANTIISTSGKDVEIVELNSLQSVSNDDISKGASYISIMQKNYDVLAGVMK